MGVSWIVEETDYQNDFAVSQRLTLLLQELGETVYNFKYIPFGGTDYGFLSEAQEPAVFYGGINSLLDMRDRRLKLPKPFAWYDRYSFLCSTYYEKLAPFIIQDSYRFIQFGELKNIFWPTKKLFIRPDDNEKTFTGEVVSREMFDAWFNMKSNYNYVQAECPCLISAVRHIDIEWRFVIVENKVVAGSQYKTDLSIDINEGYSEEAARFAENVSRYWSPYPVYIMDVGKVKDRYAIVEIGPFNYAGLYKSDLRSVVHHINKYISRRY